MKMYSLNLDEKDYEKIKDIAWEQKISAWELVRKILSDYIKSKENKD
jgi:hypothetical protein